MISWFKKHFIPHKENNHRPHILRTKSIRNVIYVVLFLEIFTFLIPTLTHINRTGGMAAVLPSILSNLTNEERQSQKIKPLAISPVLNKAAEMKAEDMATKGYFAHTSPEGKTPWYWLSLAGYDFQYAGENLAINFTDSKDVTKAWMESPTHKANIVKGNYTEMGTGIAKGVYKGKETIFVAQVYANPLIKPTMEAKTKEEIKVIEKLPEIAKKEIANVLGAETDKLSEKINNEIAVKNPTFLQKAFASPRNTTNSIVSIIFGIILISLILNIFIKIKQHHPDLITNGLIVLVIIGAILSSNYYFSHRSMTTSQSLDYSIESAK